MKASISYVLLSLARRKQALVRYTLASRRSRKILVTPRSARFKRPARCCSEEGALYKKTERQTHMLMQVVEIHRRQCIIGSVDIRRRIHHVLITHIRSRKAGIVRSTATTLFSRCSHASRNKKERKSLLIAACVTTFVCDDWQSGVHRHQFDDEVGQWRAHIVRVNCDVVVWGISSHVLVHDGKDLDAALDVVLNDGAST